MPNRNPVRQLFITFPHSSCDKNTFRDFLIQFSPDYYKVAEETHQDGTPHLHAVVKFKNKFSCAHVIKKFKDIYPDDYKRLDVKPVRSIKNSIKYLSKEDPSPLESGAYTEARNPEQNWQRKFIKQLGYDSLADLVADTKASEDERLSAVAYCEAMSSRYPGQLEEFLKKSDYSIFKLFQKFLNPEIPLSKDDMTKIKEFINYRGFSV